MRSFRTLSRFWQLLSRYLRPQLSRMGLLALILCGTIAVQVVTPLVASRFIDRATSGASPGRTDFPGPADHWPGSGRAGHGGRRNLRG